MNERHTNNAATPRHLTATTPTKYNPAMTGTHQRAIARAAAIEVLG